VTVTIVAVVLAALGALGVMSLPFLVDVSGEGSAIGRLSGSGTASASDRVRDAAVAIVFIGIAATFPGLWDRTVWVPASLAALAMLAPDKQDAPARPEAVPARRRT
jgi:hypothetical protein